MDSSPTLPYNLEGLRPLIFFLTIIPAGMPLGISQAIEIIDTAARTCLTIEGESLLALGLWVDPEWCRDHYRIRAMKVIELHEELQGKISYAGAMDKIRLMIFPLTAHFYRQAIQLIEQDDHKGILHFMPTTRIQRKTKLILQNDLTMLSARLKRARTHIQRDSVLSQTETWHIEAWEEFRRRLLKEAV